jgi:hypothetical protein
MLIKQYNIEYVGGTEDVTGKIPRPYGDVHAVFVLQIYTDAKGSGV